MMELIIVGAAGTVVGGVIMIVLPATVSKLWERTRRKIRQVRADRACSRGDHDWKFLIGQVGGSWVYSCRNCAAPRVDHD